jgi:hypothetical protein
MHVSRFTAIRFIGGSLQICVQHGEARHADPDHRRWNHAASRHIGDFELDLVNDRALAPIVARALGRERVGVLQWRWRPIAYDVYLPGRRLVRFAGRATAGGELLEWAVVLKLVGPHSALTAGQDEKWRREVRAYASGLLGDLPGGLAAPRMLAINEADDGMVWLWLEHVVDEYGGRWGLEQFQQAAYHLGEFNGAYLGQRALPGYEWLVRRWTELQSETEKIPGALAEITRRAADRRVRAAFPDHSAEEMARLLRDQPRFKAALTRLPALLCHHDASQPNLFARRRTDGSAQTVAIDWESVGHGTFGADIASLVFGTIRRGLFQADSVDALDRAVFAGYLDGLRAAGWGGDPVFVRLGYAAAIALRWFLLHGVLRRLHHLEVRGLRGSMQEPEEEATRQFVLLTRYLLERADEARRLVKGSSP